MNIDVQGLAPGEAAKILHPDSSVFHRDSKSFMQCRFPI